MTSRGSSLLSAKPGPDRKESTRTGIGPIAKKRTSLVFAGLYESHSLLSIQSLPCPLFLALFYFFAERLIEMTVFLLCQCAGHTKSATLAILVTIVLNGEVILYPEHM